LEIEAINKAKLPKIDLNAQATYQSDVTSLPISLPNVTVNPPNKDQYRATVDVQLIYNGGLPMPLLKSKKRKPKRCNNKQGQPIPTQIQNQSVVFLDLSATRATCYFNDETRTIRV
jgi:hypothetical protein